MRILIIEDEIPAQFQLERLITTHYPDSQIMAKIDSVKSSIEWLNNNKADIIFMDVELSDGQCFEIFKQVKVEVPVIITTAYSDYAIKAFKINSIDYLLKPLDENEFIEAFNKSVKISRGAQPDYNRIQELISRNMPVEYRERFIVKLNEQIKVITIDEIAYFMAEEKVTFIVLNNGKRYITDYTLDSLETMLNPKRFFRLTRSYMASINSVKSVSKYFNSRLKIKLEPSTQEEVLVSRIRVQDFLKWLEGIS